MDIKNSYDIFCGMEKIRTGYGELIKAARKRNKLNQSQLSELCGWGYSQGRISHYETETREPSLNDLVTIAKALGLKHPNELLPEWFSPANQPDIEFGEYPNISEPLPLLEWADINNWVSDVRATNEAKDFPASNPGAKAFLCVVKSDAMEPEFMRGETLIIDPTITAKHDNFVIVRFNNGVEPMLRQLSVEGSDRYFIACNKSYKPKDASDNPEILGVVIEKRKTYF